MDDRRTPSWFPYADLFCVSAACLIWLFAPEIGFWPLILGLLPWLARWSMTGRIGVHSPFDWPLLVFLLTATVSLWTAFDQTAAWNKSWLIVGAMLLFFTFANWSAAGGSSAQRNQAWLLGSLGSFISIYMLATNDWDAYPAKIGIVTAVGRAISSLRPDLPLESFHPTAMAGAMAVLIPFSAASAASAWFERNRSRLLLGLVMVLVTTVGLVMTETRGAWIAVAVAAGLVIWWLIVRSLVRRRRRRRAIFFGSIALAAAAGVLFFALVPDITERALSSLPSMESGLKRADLYRNSLALINDYPFIGAGLDNFMMLYSTYALLLHVGFSTHAHNLFMDLTIQQGVLAVFIYLWMLLLMGEAVWRIMVSRKRRRRSGNQEARSEVTAAQGESRAGGLMLAAASLSLLILVLHGIVDDTIYGSRMLLLMFIPFAFAVPVLVKTRTPARKQQLIALGFGLLILAIIAIFTWRPFSSMVRSNLAAIEQSKAELSVYHWPEWPVQDAVRAELDLSSEEEGFEKAIALNGSNTSARRRLGQIKLSLGEYDAAVEQLEAAYAQTPWDNATKQMLGEAYLVTGNVAAGETLWSQVDNQLGKPHQG
ncbi:MAG: O-antigen ligase family protein, partial [Candidatus Promineifilaceae bacterium]